MDPLAVAAACAVIAGAALQSALGFGFALVAAPLVYAAFSPPEGVGLLLVLGLEVNLLTLLAERRRPQPVWADVIPVVLWSIPGALLGVAVLRGLDDVAPDGLRAPALGQQREQADLEPEQDHRPDGLGGRGGREQKRRGDEREAEADRRLERGARQHRGGRSDR